MSKRVPVSVTLPKECVEWLDGQIKSRFYHNRSHALEVVILKVMKENGN